MKKIILCSIVLGFIYAFSATDANAQEGCVNMLGRAREKLCQTPESYSVCVGMLKQGKLDACVLQGKEDSWMRRATPAEADAELIKRSCTKLSGNIYECEGAGGLNYCNQYKIFFKNPDIIAGCKLPNTAAKNVIEAGNLYLYVIGKDGKLWSIKKNKGKWGSAQWVKGNDWVNQKFSGIDGCSPNPGKIVLMTRDDDNVIGSYFYDKSQDKMGWARYGSKIGSDPGTACQPGDRINLFVRGHNNQGLYANFAENGVWASIYTKSVGYGLAIEDVSGKAAAVNKESFWEFLGLEDSKIRPSGVLGASGLGGIIKGSPDGVWFGGNNRAVFVRGGDDFVWWRKTFDGKPWEQFENIGGMRIASDPTAISRKPGEILLFARGEDNKLYVRRYLNGNWSIWFPWGKTTVAGNPDAASWGGNRVDVFYRSANGEVYHAWLDDEAFGKEPQIEKVPDVLINGDPTAIGATW